MNSHTTKRMHGGAGPTVAVVGAVLLVSGCTAGGSDSADDAPTSASSTASPTPTPDPTATAEALAAEDATKLTMPVDEIRDWAARVVPGTEADGHIVSFSGWLSEHTSPRTVNTFESSPPGRYTVTIACTGGGPLAVSLLQPDEVEVGALEHPCDGGTQTVEVQTAAEGISAQLENPLSADPAIYAVSVVATP